MNPVGRDVLGAEKLLRTRSEELTLNYLVTMKVYQEGLPLTQISDFREF